MSYDPKLPYCIEDYIEDLADAVFETEMDAREYSLKRLRRCLRILMSNDRYYIIKKRSNPFVKYNGDIIEDYRNVAFKCRQRGDPQKFSGKHIKDDKIPIFILADDRSLWISACIFIPRNPLHSLMDEEYNVLNVFPGFKADVIDSLHMNMIESLLNYIFCVWASNDVDHFRFIISWLAAIIQKPTMLHCSLVIINRDADRRDPIGEFLARYVFGCHLTHESESPKSILDSFDRLAKSKIMLITDITTNEEEYNHVRLHNTITDKFGICNGIEFTHCCHFLFFIRGKGGLKSLEQGLRRYAIFECGGRMDVPRLNQDVANHFLTFLLYYEDRGISVHFPPYTVAARKLCDLTSEESYVLDIRGGLRVPSLKNVLREGDQIFLPFRDLYDDYLKWSEDNNIASRNAFSRFIHEILGSSEDNRKYINGKSSRSYCINPLITYRNRHHFSNI